MLRFVLHSKAGPRPSIASKSLREELTVVPSGWPEGVHDEVKARSLCARTCCHCIMVLLGPKQTGFGQFNTIQKFVAWVTSSPPLRGARLCVTNGRGRQLRDVTTEGRDLHGLHALALLCARCVLLSPVKAMLRPVDARGWSCESAPGQILESTYDCIL